MDDINQLKTDILRRLGDRRMRYNDALVEYKQSIGFDNDLAEGAFGNLIYALKSEGLIEWKADAELPNIVREIWLSDKGKATAR